MTPGSHVRFVFKVKRLNEYHLQKKPIKQLAVFMAHDQSIIQALSIFHSQEKTKQEGKETLLFILGKNGLNMEVNGDSFHILVSFFLNWFLINGIL